MGLFPTAVCFWVSISGSRGLVPGMRSELRGCAGFRDLSPGPGFRDLSPGFRDFWNLVSHHCVSFYGPSGFRGFIRVPGFLDFCFPSLCFFWFGTCFPGSGTFGTLSPIIFFLLWSIRARDFIRVSGFLDFCLPSLCFFLWFIRAPGFLEPCLASLCLFCGPSGRGTSSGFRDSWTFVSHHCVSSGSGTCLPSIRTCLPGSGTFGTLSPIIVFFLVVYQGSGIFGNLSPIIVFVLWSIRARDFIRVSGFLDFCLPSLCFFLWFIRAPGFLEPGLPSLCLFCGPSGRGASSGFRDSWTFVSHHCVSSGSGTCLPSSRTCLPGSGTCGTLSPIIVFFLVVYEGSGIFGNSQQQSLLGFNL